MIKYKTKGYRANLKPTKASPFLQEGNGLEGQQGSAPSPPCPNPRAGRRLKEGWRRGGWWLPPAYINPRLASSLIHPKASSLLLSPSPL